MSNWSWLHEGDLSSYRLVEEEKDRSQRLLILCNHGGTNNDDGGHIAMLRSDGWIGVAYTGQTQIDRLDWKRGKVENQPLGERAPSANGIFE